MITGAMRSTPNDLIEAHTDLLPFRLLVDKHLHRAAVRLATIPPAHPLHKPVQNAANRNVKRHFTPLHSLMHTYEIKPKAMETIAAVRQNTTWTPNLTTRIAESAALAEQQSGEDRADIRVYSDGSGIGGKIGAAAVLYRGGVLKSRRRLRLGSEKRHTVYEGEGIGMILGLELIREERGVGAVTMGVDNQAAITATGLRRPAPSHYIWDMFHKRLEMVQGRHQDMEIEIRWTPGHKGIEGNEEADKEAKMAAEQGSSERAGLPAPLRKALPYSKSATRMAYTKKLKRKAKKAWEASTRYERIKDIDPSLPSSSFRKLVAPLSRKHASVLIQLRSGHIPLNKHLHRIGKAESPICPCCRQHEETVHHFLIRCPAHRNARTALTHAAGRDATSLHKLLSKPKLIPHLFRFIGRAGRLRSVFGDLTPTS
jgi:ribonuclease HI